MHVDIYQIAASDTAIYPGAGDCDSIEGLSYVTMGLVGEAGEIANKVKKILRDKDGVITQENRDDLQAELGDVMWYVAQLANQLDVWLSTVTQRNLNKLQSRKDRGVIQGSGDNR
ncbi:MazG-like pyrophosphatase [Fromanvirus L5]|uniref:Gene 37 protein n=1 Tax=Mycobacterium phage L5 TaxID=31757 RepID=VG37_BPML5|nr:MazG-like pyrophosphatase [Fromanvirus L5]Q05247.1 RecName: Full=Gene 37 protein; AltName: Full=Gp37 [Fromanvirus L5]CAA79413.1 Hypothetical Protein PBI_L5_37 [Fromanvirus L5]